MMTLEAPHRVVIDLYGAELADPSLAQALPIDDGPFHQLRVALHLEAGFVRFVLDCDQGTHPKIVSRTNGSLLVVATAPEAEARRASEAFGPPVPQELLVYGPSVPRELRLYGPPAPEAIASESPLEAVETSSPSRESGPQVVSSVALAQGHGHTTLVLSSDRPLRYELHQAWVPPRLSVRVAKGSFHGSLPAPGEGIEGLEAHQEGGDWVLTCALARGVYAVEQQQTREGRQVAIRWHRETLDAHLPTVILDAGHGGDDPGAIGPLGTHESRITLALVKATAAALAARADVNVVLTRTTDAAVDLASRSRLIEALHPALFVSLHGNSCASDTIGGFETYYRNDVSLPLAKYLHHALIHALDRPDRGVRQAHLFVLRSLQVPSVLIESAYVSNPREERLLSSDDFQHDLGAALANGILGFLAETPVAELSGKGQGDD